MADSTRDDATVLVTGASTGLGLAIALELVRRTRFRLALSARAGSLARFAAAGIAAGERIMLVPLDVTDDAERRAAIAAIEARWQGVDILINNAGVSYRSVVEHVSDSERLAQMDINFLAPMELIRLVLPHMRGQRRGHIVNISSVGGMMAMPTMAVYSASKFALEGASEALYYEVRPWNIHVTLVQPGFIHSASFENVRHTALSGRSVTDPEEPYHCHYEHMAPFIARMMERSSATPERVARTIVKVMRRRRPPLRIAGTPDARLFSALRRLLPRRLYHWALYRSLPHVRSWGTRALPGAPRRSQP
jgi:short-subunit dehydrogenase